LLCRACCCWAPACGRSAACGYSAVGGAKPGIVRQGLGGLLAGVGLLYPLVGLLAGRSLWQVEVFGLAPEPTALVTLGLLLLSPYLVARTGGWLLLVIPALSLLLGAATHWTFLV
jgi:hypothetical protein